MLSCDIRELVRSSGQQTIKRVLESRLTQNSKYKLCQYMSGSSTQFWLLPKKKAKSKFKLTYFRSLVFQPAASWQVQAEARL